MSKITEIGVETFKPEVLDASTAVLVDFYAPWCGPCQMLAPILDALADEFAGKVKFVKISVDDAQELAYRYRITGVPTLMLFRDGQVADTIVGLTSPRSLRAKLESAVAAPEPAPVFGRR